MAQKITEGNYSSFTTCYSLDAIEFDGEKLFIIETKYEGKTIGDLFNEDSINFIICDFLCDWFCYGSHDTEISEEEDMTNAYIELFNDNQDKFLSSSELFKSSGCGGDLMFVKNEINFIKVTYPKYEFLKNLLRFKRMKFLKN